jgi:hypothetical protein
VNGARHEVSLFRSSVNEYGNGIKISNGGHACNKSRTYGIPWKGIFWVREQRAKGFESWFLKNVASCALIAIFCYKYAHSKPPKHFRNI